jgi:hypothetical protein
MTMLNNSAGGNAGFGILFAIERQWPAALQPGCWPERS